ncbi:hypothetical protein [Pedobacter frigiditerrae]|uniref:hypothetical protein n=1 Tax=Pedobacter frigiditerrae TaxID=2530452 RepID=UPI00292FA6ED|nr:hypothetical protein [Pedobacter frigiditerrae]
MMVKLIISIEMFVLRIEIGSLEGPNVGKQESVEHKPLLSKPDRSGHDPDSSSGEVKRIAGLSQPISTETAFQIILN